MKNEADKKAPKPGKGGQKYIPYAKRTGLESIVYFTRDLSAAGFQKAYEKVCANIKGKVAVKLHTGEPHGPNIIPREWVKNLLEKVGKETSVQRLYDGEQWQIGDCRIVVASASSGHRR